MYFRKDRKGFTLSELLIVIAIIAVLVAVMIPVFTSQLEKAREGTDIANIRSAYAAVVNEGLTEGNETATTFSNEVGLVQTVDGWQTQNIQEVLDGLGNVIGTPQKQGGCTVSYDSLGGVCTFQFTGSKPVSISPSYKNKLKEQSEDFANLVDHYMKQTQNETVARQLKSRGTTDVVLDAGTSDEKTVSMYYFQTGDGQIRSYLTTPMKEAGYTDEDINSILGSFTSIYLDTNGQLIAYAGPSSGGVNPLYFMDGSPEQRIGGAAANKEAVARYLVEHGKS